MRDVFLTIGQKSLFLALNFLGGENVNIMLVLIRFSEMRVFLQMRFFNDFFENLKGEKRT